MAPLDDGRIARRRVREVRGVKTGVVALGHEHVVVAGVPAEQRRRLEHVRVPAAGDDAPLLAADRHERAIVVRAAAWLRNSA
jgi:hypothetical protein